MRFLILIAAFLFAISTVQAADGIVVDCGAPMADDLPTESSRDFCDIYTRQMAFGEARKALSTQLRERQQNFYAPAKQAKDNYKANVEALRTTPQSVEPYGPPDSAAQ